MRTPTLTPDAAQLLLAYTWPGNVRELRNVTERLVARDRSRLTPDDLPSEIRGIHTSGLAVAAATRGDTAAPTAVMTLDASAETVHRLWARAQGAVKI